MEVASSVEDILLRNKICQEVMRQMYQGGVSPIEEWVLSQALIDSRNPHKSASFLWKRVTECKNGRQRYDARPAAPVMPSPVPPGLRYDILQRDHFACRLCGASPVNTPGAVLEVDHIVPRSKGGSNDPWNLQALCFLCNRGKRDKDATP